MINELLSFIFYPIFNKVGESYFIVFMSFFLVLVTTLIYIKFTPQRKLKKLKREIKELAREAKSHIGNNDILFDINKEMSKKNMEVMQHTLFSNMFMMIPMFLVIGWMGSIVTTFDLAGYELPWFAGYIILSICFSIIIRNLLDVQ